MLKLWREDPTLMAQVDQLPAQMLAGDRTKGGIGDVILEMMLDGAWLEVSLRSGPRV
jgi:hypothetical protein